MKKTLTAAITIAILALYGAQPAAAISWTLIGCEYNSTLNAALEGRVTSADLNHDDAVDILDLQRAAVPVSSSRGPESSDDADAPFTAPPNTIVLAAAITAGPIEFIPRPPAPSVSLAADYDLLPSFQRVIAHQVFPHAPPTL
ncbi:MAG: hypothetical protein AAB353_05005 [Candidatus Hydrogenedentota bacterium]